MTMPSKPIDRIAADVVREVLDCSVIEGAPLTCVDSPPGAGKTWLAEQAVSLATTQAGMSVCCVTPRARQGVDLAQRLVDGFDLPRLELLISKHRSPPSGLIDRVPIIDSVHAIGHGPGVVVSTVDKIATHLQHVPANRFDLLVVDEAYQLPFKQFLPIASVAPRVLLVGDPGQLPPLVTANTSRIELADHRVHWPALKELRRQQPDRGDRLGPVGFVGEPEPGEPLASR